MKVLVYTADSEARRALTEVLRRRGHQVTAPEEADSAGTAYQSQDHPLAVFDVDSPDGSGAALCRRVRQLAHGKSCVILALTRRTDPAHLGELLASGFDDYLPDPIGDGKLLEVRLEVAERRVGASGLCWMALATGKRPIAGRCALSHDVPFGVFHFSREGRFLKVNQALVKMLGYRCEAELLAVDPVRDVCGDPKAYQRLIAQPKAYVEGLELDWKRKDGTPIAVCISGHTVRDEQGTPLGFEGIIEDVTERRRAEEALRESEQHYRQLLAAVTTYTYTVKIEHGLPVSTEHSRGCLATTGYAPEDYASNASLWFEMIHPDDREMVRQQVAKVLAGHVVPPIEHRILHRDGTTRWVRDTIVCHCDDASRLDHYDGLLEEITERKRVEERFRRLVESAPDAMVIVDAAGRIILVNAQTEECFGYPREELLGQPVEKLIPERFCDRHVELRAGYVASPYPRPLKAGLDLYGLRKDGSEFPVEISLSPLETEEEVLVSAAIRDVTERKRVERAIRENEAQLLAAQRIQEHLLPDAPPALSGFDIAGALYPAEFAAGDYFDYLAMRDGSLGVVIGDVSGHGFGPALLMASTHALLRSLANHHTQLGEILGIANSILAEQTEADRFVTLLFGCLDVRSRSFVYANAGHATGYVLDISGRVKARLESTALPLAILPDAEFPTADPIALEPGDIVLLLTDGIPEARSSEDVPFGDQRALEIVRENRDRTAREITESLYRAVRDFSGGKKPIDDVTTVVIKMEPTP